jgi:trehalose 6-phosphate phosphatase
MNRYSFDAVIFDLDGVITKTALVHAQAWKLVFDEYLRLREKRNNESFREFTHKSDYLPYVDGKPRYEGVKSFLESRGIQIPFGSPSDPPDKETICGIGNKKNTAFLEVLKDQGVEVYSSTIRFIKELKKVGIKIGVISSSKNCRYILQSAGIEDLFQTRVDGEVSIELGIKGKPEPDIFVTAAYNLGTVPARAVVVEDAISGVQAGRNGGFGLVLGLARKDNESALLKNGADVAMKDISEINLKWVEKWFHKKPEPLFKFWDKAKSVFFSKKKPVFFLDYDGTLTPIVKRPELAVISQDMKRVLVRLSEKYTTAIVSGRAREDVEKLLGIKNLIYAGSHGFDILGPGISLVEPRAEEAIPLIREIVKQLSEELDAIPGIVLEEKKFSVAVHYRLVDEQYLPKIKDSIERIIKNNRSLRLMSGKKVFEILPNIDWDKGRAIRWIMQALGIRWFDVSVVYIGDDTTDEDAFRMVRTRGTGILVSDKPKESAADFQLSSTEEVKKLFEKIITPVLKK